MKRIQENRQTTSETSQYECDKCKDTGWLVDGNIFKRCECFAVKEALMMFENSGIKDENYTFSNFQEWNETSKSMKITATQYYQNFTKIMNDRQNSIALLGQVGSGKTHLTLALGLNIMKSKKLPVVYFSYRDTITSIKQNMTDEEYYRRQLDRFQNAKVLLIDDMLKGKTSDSDKNIMFEIINYRYINRKPIIVSSEYGIEDLLNFDEAIGSRIYEMCKDYMVEVQNNTSNNYRLRS
ncbi:ATP-binding protein [Sedimentibacter hydroxybenzoicus DSM 7310]|uniref:ATP-binding protein n=1 Tax=Sedimentibacter hydroxybenzoicus DSM 7310 TaxID=1123245 RepID=A0A974BJN1_SEDHY|nr:ATP-binding protein [Sedimentibacter hydroxybenzoicus]NYB73880.1 ATP-binding protein [Sedimentibacter hydroxybenzoicus DSM 7310]